MDLGRQLERLGLSNFGRRCHDRQRVMTVGSRRPKRMDPKTTLTPSSLPTEVGQLLGAEAPRSHPRCLRAVKLFGPNTPSAPEGECTRTAAVLLRGRRAKPSPDAPSHCQPVTLAVPIPQDRCNRGRPSAVRHCCRSALGPSVPAARSCLADSTVHPRKGQVNPFLPIPRVIPSISGKSPTRRPFSTGSPTARPRERAREPWPAQLTGQAG